MGERCLTENLILPVRFNATCAIYPLGDEFKLDQSIGGSFDLDVLGNDELCDLQQHVIIKIIQQPSSGTISVVNGKIRYENAAAVISDSFRYTVCTSNGFCSNSSAVVKLGRH